MSDATMVGLRLDDDVRAAAAGDQRAFARLVDATAATVTSITLAILRDVEHSRDVAQEVYLAAWRDLHRLKEPSSFLPWIRQVARNQARHSLRGEARRRARVTVADAPDAVFAAAADPDPGALERLVSEEEQRALREAIDELPDGTREAVILFYREGESVRQVALLLDLSEAAVKQRLTRARASMRASVARTLRQTGPDAAFTAAVVAAVTLAWPAAASATGLALGHRGILQSTAVNMTAVLGFGVAVVANPTPLTATIAFAALILVIALTHFVWMPRIVARRLEAERQADPVAYERERLRRRRAAVLGMTLGLLFGGGAIVAAWLLG